VVGTASERLGKPDERGWVMAESDRIRWDQRYSGEEEALSSSPPWIEDFDGQIPRNGPALDIAAGSGRLSLWLASRGLTVTAVDISAVGLQLARCSAELRELTIETVVSDLETEPLPQGVFQVITCFRYWQPELFPAIKARLNHGGFLLAEVATKQNLEMHDRPSSRYLAEPEALRKICRPMEVVYYQEGWIGDWASARIVARKV